MATADGVNSLGNLISALGQTMQQMPGAPMTAAGRALDLAGNYISKVSDAAINAIGGGSKSNAEVAGHFFSQWLDVISVG